jgi:hypothetical protein
MEQQELPTAVLDLQLLHVAAMLRRCFNYKLEERPSAIDMLAALE